MSHRVLQMPLLVVLLGSAAALAGPVPLLVGPASPCSATIDLGPGTPQPQTKLNGQVFDHLRWMIACTDGDPSCDADGVADGKCSFAVGICVGQTAHGCHPNAVTSLRFYATPGDNFTRPVPSPPTLGSSEPSCGASSAFVLKLHRRKNSLVRSRWWRAWLRVRTEKRGGEPAPSSRSAVFAVCLPPPASPSGAFVDRF